jgi:hypothetical protein
MIADEWKATPLNNVFSLTTVGMVVLTAILWALRPHARPWWQISLLAFAAGLSLWMWRLVPLGSIAVAPLLAAAIQEAQPSTRRERFSRHERWSVMAGCLALLVAAGAICAGPRGESASQYPTALPVIDKKLHEIPPRTVVLDDFGVSGWLLWAHPDLTPVADLRGEIYSHQYLASYRDALLAKPGWEAFVAETGAQVALLKKDSALADALENRAGWTVVSNTKDFTLLKRA